MTKPRLSHPPRPSVVSSPVHLNQVDVQHHPKGVTRPFPRCIHFSHIEVFDISRVGLSKPVNRESKAAKRASSDRPHGTTLDIVEECYRALRRAVGLSEELALGTDVVVAACPKSPRSKVCKVQPNSWLIDTGSGHDLVDFVFFFLDSAQLIGPANSATSCFTLQTMSAGRMGPSLWTLSLFTKLLRHWSLRTPLMFLALGSDAWSMVTVFIGLADKFPAWSPLMVSRSSVWWRTTCLPCLRHTNSPKDSLCLPPKTRLEEALSRPNEPPASGCNAPASGGGA